MLLLLVVFQNHLSFLHLSRLLMNFYYPLVVKESRQVFLRVNACVAYLSCLPLLLCDVRHLRVECFCILLVYYFLPSRLDRAGDALHAEQL